MKIFVLHLSDIHVHGAEDSVLELHQKIASVCYERARLADLCLMVVTGDISYSADCAQYEAAEKFLGVIKSCLLDEGCPRVEIITCPGNHDCQLIPTNVPRNIIIDSVISKPDTANNEQIVASCTTVQENYRKFRDKITTLSPVFEDMLFSEYEVVIGEESVLIASINTSWMSRIPEVQGQLVFPIDKYDAIFSRDATVKLALIHHPINWYAQNSSHPLRKALRSHFDVVFSGHEHSMNCGEINELKAGRSFYLESSALQPHEQDAQAGFSLTNIDSISDTINIQACEIKGAIISESQEAAEYIFGAGARAQHGHLHLKASFESMIRDPGGNFVHPEKDEIHLEDIFIYPELEDKEVDDADYVVPAEVVLIGRFIEKKVLMMGDDKAGKTCLLLRAFQELHALGMVPLYIKASEINSVSESELARTLKKIAASQYDLPESVSLAERGKKIALIDDIDRLPGGPKNQVKILQYIESQFGMVVLTAAAGLELAELVDKDAAAALGKYHFYEIRQFGSKMRHKLIKKWCLCGDVRTVRELDRRVHDVETLIDTVVGRNLVPCRPIYLLILLQSCEQQEQGELLNSGLAYYYQYLITKSLKEAGVKPDQMNELYHYLASLAWFVRCNGGKEISENDFYRFTDEFSKKIVTVNFQKRMELLCQARLLAKYGDSLCFAYPYIYYFFLGKYLSMNMADQEVKAIVASSCAALNRKESAHTVLFLIHHNNDGWVMDLIVQSLRDCFSEFSPIALNGDIEGINKLVNAAPQLLLGNIDVDENQERSREAKDKYEREDVEEGLANSIDVAKKLVTVMKTSEILGQILKSYYGSINRDKKREYLREVYNAPLRLLGFLLSEINQSPELFASELAKFIGHNSGEKVKLSDETSKKAAFNLLGMMCTGLILRAAQFSASEKLAEDIDSVVTSEGTEAYKLIGAATFLAKPGDIKHETIAKLAREMRENKFAFLVLQSLAVFHIQMFHTSDKDKQKLCSALDIKIETSREIDFATRNAKLKSGK